MEKNSLVIDLSHHNTVTDFDKIPAIGIIHKASEGLSMTDQKYTPRKDAWQDRGKLFGAYHFIRNNGIKEAKYFLNFVKPDDKTLLALDWEVAIGKGQCEDFVKVIYDTVGRYPLFYLNNSMLNSNNFENSILLNCPLWVARYGKSPVIPDCFGKYALWQYTESGTNLVDSSGRFTQRVGN